MTSTLYRDTIKQGHDKVGVSGTEPWDRQGELVRHISVLKSTSGKTPMGVWGEPYDGRRAG